jgi:hypothetical protein
MKMKQSSRCNNYQESIYFHWKQNPLSDAYHLPFIYEISGNFLLGQFMMSCHALFENLFAFGLKFGESGSGQVFSVYDEACLPQVQFQTLSADTKAGALEAFQQCKAEFFSRPFDLDKGLTFYMDIVRIEPSHTYYLLVNCHHIISDAYSFYEIVRRLSELYNSGGATAPLGGFSTGQGKYNTLNLYINDGEARADEFVKGQFEKVFSFDQFQLDYSRSPSTSSNWITAKRKERAAKPWCWMPQPNNA